MNMTDYTLQHLVSDLGLDSIQSRNSTGFIVLTLCADGDEKDVILSKREIADNFRQFPETIEQSYNQYEWLKHKIVKALLK